MSVLFYFTLSSDSVSYFDQLYLQTFLGGEISKLILSQRDKSEVCSEWVKSLYEYLISSVRRLLFDITSKMIF